MRVLAGDIGGTKTLLQIVDCANNARRVVAENRYASGSYDGLVSMLREFLGSAGLDRASQIHGACFGVAGPITDIANAQRAQLTNLPWEIDTADLARALGTERVRLINDFQAIGYGIEALAPHDVVVLQEGAEIPRAPRVVIGAGTGLGVGILVWQRDHYEALPTEGGHADFAPTDELQTDLLRYLRETTGHVSYERVLSGPGILNIYSYLCAGAGQQSDLAAARQADDPAAAIASAALEGKDKLARRALDVFVMIYGAEAGNLALTCLARGGVYIAGGIAPKLIDKLGEPAFMRAFNDKARMAAVTATMPVRVVMNPAVGLLGASLAAGRL